jgi:hypothetical protein
MREKTSRCSERHSTRSPRFDRHFIARGDESGERAWGL